MFISGHFRPWNITVESDFWSIHPVFDHEVISTPINGSLYPSSSCKQFGMIPHSLSLKSLQRGHSFIAFNF